MRITVNLNVDGIRTWDPADTPDYMGVIDKYVSDYWIDAFTGSPNPDPTLTAAFRGAGGNAGVVTIANRPRCFFIVDAAGRPIEFKVIGMRASKEFGVRYGTDYARAFSLFGDSEGDDLLSFFFFAEAMLPRLSINAFPSLPQGTWASEAEGNENTIAPDGSTQERQLIKYILDSSKGTKVTANCNRLFQATARTISGLSWAWQNFLGGMKFQEFADTQALYAAAGVPYTFVMTQNVYLTIDVQAVPGQNGALPEFYLCAGVNPSDAGAPTTASFKSVIAPVVGPPVDNKGIDQAWSNTLQSQKVLFIRPSGLQNTSILAAAGGGGVTALSNDTSVTTMPFLTLANMQASFNDFNPPNSFLMAF